MARERKWTAIRMAFLLPLLSPVAGCGGGLAAIGSGVAGAALPAARGESSHPVHEGQVSGEVLELDELQRRIVLTTDDGRSGSLLYDANTIVVHQQEHHPIDFIRSGDRVVIQTRQEGNGPVMAVRIDVHRQSGEPSSRHRMIEPDPAQQRNAEGGNSQSRCRRNWRVM